MKEQSNNFSGNEGMFEFLAFESTRASLDRLPFGSQTSPVIISLMDPVLLKHLQTRPLC